MFLASRRVATLQASTSSWRGTCAPRNDEFVTSRPAALCSWTRPAPRREWQASWGWDDVPRTQSSVGCGDSSNDIVNYEAAGSPPAVKVPDLLSIDPGKVATELSSVGLVGHETGSSKGNVDVPQVVTQSPLPGWLALAGATVDYSVQVPEGGLHQAP